MTEQSDTPRTDAEIDDARNLALDFECRPKPPAPGENIHVVLADFSRQLERELNAAHEWHAEMIRINRGLTEQIASLQGELTQWKKDVAHQGLILATICDMVLGENADDRSDDALMRGVRKLLNDLDEAKLPRLEEVQMPNVMARIAKLENDKARLDWLEKRGVCFRGADKLYEETGDDRWEGWIIGSNTEWAYADAREAIDAAIAATQQHSQPKQ